MRLALAASLLVVGGALALLIAAGRADVTRAPAGDADAARIAELVMGARNTDRFGAWYPTLGVGWRQQALARPIVSRPPGLDLAVRAARAAAPELTGRDAPPDLQHPRAARALALGASAAALLALARLAWIGWGPAGAAAGAALFALSPYVAGYATFPHGEMLALAAVLMALGSGLRFRQVHRRLAVASAVTWLVIAGLFDWSAYLVVVPLLVLAFIGQALARRLTRVRPSMLGLPDGLAGPLANVMLQREEDTALALARALAIAMLIELAAFLALFLWLGALPHLGAALAGGGGGGGLTAPRVSDPSPIGAGTWLVIAAWSLSALARFAIGRAEARSTAVAALLGAGLLFPLLLPGLARAGLHVPALVAAGGALAAIDLAAVLGALAARRTLAIADPPPTAALVMVGLLVAAAAATVPAYRHTRAERLARPAPGGPGERAFADALADSVEVGDRLLALEGFPLPLWFLATVDRDVELLPAAGELAARAGAAAPAPTLVLAAEPFPAEAAPALDALLRQHPALRVGPRWLIDLRRHEPGIRSLGPDGPGGAMIARPREELELDLAHGVMPSADYLPEITLEAGLPRDELYAYHNLRAARRAGQPDPERARLRAALLAGFELTPRWFDPAPGGQPIGVRLGAGDGRVEVVWECPEAPTVLPGGLLADGVRLILRRGEARPVAVERPFSAPCARGAQAGDLHEQSFEVKVPARGRFQVALQLLANRLPLSPAPTTLGTVEVTSNEPPRPAPPGRGPGRR